MVVELLTTDLDITNRFNPALIWVDVSTITGIRPGWQNGATGFLPPPVPPAVAMPTLSQLKAQIAAISAQLIAMSSGP